MKLSELTNDQAGEIMIKLADPIGRICDDEEAVAMVDEYKKDMRKPLFYVIGRILPRLVAYFMGHHKSEVYEVVSILAEKPLKEVGKMNFSETLAIIKDSYDDVLGTFFTSSGIARNGAGIR